MQFDPAQLLNSGTTGVMILLAMVIYRLVTAKTDGHARGNVAKSYSDIMGALDRVVVILERREKACEGCQVGVAQIVAAQEAAEQTETRRKLVAEEVAKARQEESA